jgi:hypothetical protein
MALEIFKLFGSIQVDNDKANESIEKTDKKAQNIGSTLLKGVGTAAKWGAGIATAAGAGVTALTGMASKVADTAGAIADSAARAGVTAEAYQQYAYAAKMSGIETSKLDSLMVKSQKSFADAKEGSKALGEAYGRLGIDISSIDNSSDAFDTTIAALAEMSDETERNALANDIFGKSYADLAPLLNEGAAGIAALKQEAVDMGAVMSNESVAAGEQFGDTMDKIKSAGAGLFNSLGSELIPIAQQFTNMLISNLPMIQNLFAQLAPIIAMVFSNLLPPVMELVQTLLPPLIELFTTLLPIISDIISDILPIFTDLLKMLLPPLIEIVKALLPPMLEVIKALMPILKTVIELLKPILDLFMKLLAPIMDLVSKAIAPLITRLADLINTILKPIIPVIKMVADIISSVLGTAFEALQPIIDNIMGYFEGLIDFITGIFTGNWKKAFEGIQKIVKNIFEGMINIVKAPINFIIKGINAFIGGLNKLKIPDWVPGIGGKGINIPEIPELAEGGTIYKRGRVLVGEEAPEILDLPAGARVTPLTNAQKSLNEDKERQINLNVNLNIKEFINNTMADINEIAKEIAFTTKRELEGVGVYV